MIKKLFNKYKKMPLPVKAAFWYTFCSFLNRAIGLITTPIFTRIMTEEQYGTFSVFQSWFNIIIIFTSLNLYLSGYTKGLIKFKDDRDNFTSSQLFLTTVLTFVFIGIYFSNSDFWISIFNFPKALMLAMFTRLLLAPAYDFWMSRKRFDYKYKSVVILSLFVNIVSLLVSVIAVILCSENAKIEARANSDALIRALVYLPIFIYIFIKGKKFFKLKYFKYALAFNIPLIPHYLSTYILNQSDRIMISQMVGNTQAGIYSISYTIGTAMILLITSANDATTPYIYKTISSGISSKIDKIKKLINPIAVIIAGFCAIITLLAPEIIKIFAGDNYIESIYIIPPVAASVYFIYIYSVFSSIEYYYQKTTRIAIATTISALTNIALNFIGIKIFGYMAAGYTTLICYILLSIFHFSFYKSVTKEKSESIQNIYDSKILFLIGIILCIFSALMSLVYNWLIIRIALFIIIIILTIIKRKSLVNTLKAVLGKKNESN